jgi:Zn-dependent oligopeptidase
MLYQHLTPENIKKTTDDYILTLNDRTKTICAIPDEQLTFKNLFGAIEEMNENADVWISLMSNLHPDGNIQLLCKEMARKLVSNSEISYKQIYYCTRSDERETLNSEKKRYLAQVMKDFRQNGYGSLSFDDATCKRINLINDELHDLGRQFIYNLNTYNKTYELTSDDLTGMSSKWLDDHRAGDGYYVNTSDINTVMKHCTNRRTRIFLSRELNRVCYDENNEISRKIFELRNELSSYYNKPSYSDYVLQNTLIGNSENVIGFLDKTRDLLADDFTEDFDIIKQLALEDNVYELTPPDVIYYFNKYLQKLDIDTSKYSEYFNIYKVTDGVFKIFGDLLGYTFVDITENHDVWHPDVKLFEVLNTSAIGSDSDCTQGYLYLDILPRQNKYTNDAAFNISGSTGRKPICIISCNFPTFLTPENVKSFFHEFGHAMHTISSRPEFTSLAGINVVADAVECPSQLFEQFFVQPEVLKILAPGITDVIINKIITSMKLFEAYDTMRLVSFYYLDIALHGPKENLERSNLNELYVNIAKSIGLPYQEDYGYVQKFIHAINFSVKTYGYLYSKYLAKCIFGKFTSSSASSILDPNLGMELRSKLLAPGDTRDFSELIRDFMGADISYDFI